MNKIFEMVINDTLNFKVLLKFHLKHLLSVE